jgi:hypothetical protein
MLLQRCTCYNNSLSCAPSAELLLQRQQLPRLRIVVLTAGPQRLVKHSQVSLKTTIGNLDIELWPKEAPKVCYTAGSKAQLLS